MDIKCPACASRNVTSEEVASSFSPLFGSPFEFKELVYTCGDCGLEGDFDPDPKSNNDARLNAAEQAAQLRDAGRIIESLKEKGIRMSQAERALGLPQRTMFRWKKEGLTSAAFALLNIVNEFPDLLEVCEERFSLEAKRRFFWKQNSAIHTANATLTEMRTSTSTAGELPNLTEPVAA